MGRGGWTQAGDSMWVVKHIPCDVAGPQLTEAFKGMGWDAVAVKPFSATTWSVSAKDKPPSPHIFINGSFAVAVPAGGVKPRTLASFVHHGIPSIATTRTSADRTAPWEDDMEVSTLPSRTEEIKGEMADQIEQVVKTRIQDTQSQVAMLEKAIMAQDAKLQEMEVRTTSSLQQVHTKQQQAEQRLEGIEQQVGGISQTVVQQMNNMLQNMTTTLIGRLDALEGYAKRSRREGQPYWLGGCISVVETTSHRAASLQRQCYAYFLQFALISCLVCRLGLVVGERWATSAQHQIQRCAVWLGSHVSRPSYHANIVLCNPWIDKPQGRWVSKSIILIGFLQFVFAAIIHMSSRFWAWDSLIPMSSSWDPLITMNTVAVAIACDVWAVCPDFRLILYRLGWFGTMCFCMWCFWHARP